MIQADASEVANLARDMAGAGRRVTTRVEGIMEQGGELLAARARELIRGQITGTYLPHYPDAITSEVEHHGSQVEAVAGPEFGRSQGGMGPGVEFGSAHTAPRPHLHPALDEVAPKVARELGAAGAQEAL